MASCERGNRSADCDITRIVEEYAPRLRAYIRGRVGCREDAEDILQDVFCQLVRVSQTDGGEITRMASWLYKVARNAVLNLWRSRRDVRVSYPGDDDSACEGLSDILFGASDGGPEKEYMRRLVWQELEYALAELPPEQSEVFCLTVFDNIPVKDISAATGVSVATLLSRKHYAVKFLRMRLRGLYEDIMIS